MVTDEGSAVIILEILNVQMNMMMAVPGSTVSNIRHSSKLLATQFLLVDVAGWREFAGDNLQHMGGTRHLGAGAVCHCACKSHFFEVVAAAIQRLGSKSDPERKHKIEI